MTAFINILIIFKWNNFQNHYIPLLENICDALCGGFHGGDIPAYRTRASAEQYSESC